MDILLEHGLIGFDEFRVVLDVGTLGLRPHGRGPILRTGRFPSSLEKVAPESNVH